MKGLNKELNIYFPTIKKPDNFFVTEPLNYFLKLRPLVFPSFYFLLVATCIP